MKIHLHFLAVSYRSRESRDFTPFPRQTAPFHPRESGLSYTGIHWKDMPELPEVETIARGLASRVQGDVIESVWLGSKPEPLKSPAFEIAATLENKRIAGVRRMGKHIVFDLESFAPKRAPAGTRPCSRRPEEPRFPAPPHPPETSGLFTSA